MLKRKIDYDKNVISKIAKGLIIIGLIALTFLQGKRIFVSFEVQKRKICFPERKNSIVTCVKKTDSFLKSNKLF